MSESSTKLPTKIRTFAADIEAVRAQNGDTSSTPTKVPTKVTEPEKVSKPKKTTEPTYAASPQPLRHNPEKSKAVTTTQTNHTKTKPEKKHSVPAPTIGTIPPFHEIDKKKKTEAAVIKAAKSKAANKQPEKSHQEGPARVNIGYDATVITDTKTNQFKLIPSIIKSLQAWFKKITTRKKKATPKYVIPEAQRRKGVIQRAASKTGTIFTADNETLKEQIRRRQQEQQPQWDDDTETSWSPYTEPGYALLEAPEDESDSLIQNVQVEYKKTRFVPPAEKIQTISPAAPIISAADSNPEPTEITETTTQKTTVASSSQKIDPDVNKHTQEKIELYEPQTTTVTEPDQEVEEPSEDIVAEQEISSSVDIPVQSTLSERQRVPINRYDTNTLTVILLSIIISLGVLAIASELAFQHIQKKWFDTTVQIDTTIPILRGSSLNEIVITAETAEQLPQLIRTAITSAPAGIVEFSLVPPLGKEISPSYTFDLLQFRTLPTFRQSLTTARFVTVNRSQPAIVLQFTDKDTVLGGLLQWEETMAADFRHIYDSLPQETSLQFIDETIDGVDVRVLRSETGVLLVYGFLGERTVLISRTIEDFAQISSFGPR